MSEYDIYILRKNKNIPKLLNKIEQMVNENQLGLYYWFTRSTMIYATDVLVRFT